MQGGAVEAWGWVMGGGRASWQGRDVDGMWRGALETRGGFMRLVHALGGTGAGVGDGSASGGRRCTWGAGGCQVLIEQPVFADNRRACVVVSLAQHAGSGQDRQA